MTLLAIYLLICTPLAGLLWLTAMPPWLVFLMGMVVGFVVLGIALLVWLLNDPHNRPSDPFP